MTVFNCVLSKYPNSYFIYYFMILMYKYKTWLLYSSANISCKVLCCLLNWSRIIYVFYLLSFITSTYFTQERMVQLHKIFVLWFGKKFQPKNSKLGNPLQHLCFRLCKVVVLLTSCLYNMWFLYNWYWCHQKHESTHWLTRAFSDM